MGSDVVSWVSLSFPDHRYMIGQRLYAHFFLINTFQAPVVIKVLLFMVLLFFSVSI